MIPHEHLTPDEMVLHYYSEGCREPEERLAECPQCRAEYRALQRVLNAADGYAPPERDCGFEARLWERLRRELPVRQAEPRWRLHWRALSVAAALAVAIFFIGRWSAPNRPDPALAGNDVLMEAVGDHIDRSQFLLQEVANDPRTAAPREELADLLGANRLYRQTAAMSGEPAMADLLDELEQLLVEMQNVEQTNGEVREMVFKLRVAAAELRKAKSGKEDRL